MPLKSSFNLKKNQDIGCILKMFTTFVSKECSCIFELNKVINFDAKYF